MRAPSCSSNARVAATSVFATEERGRLRGEVVEMAIEALERWELDDQTGTAQLVDVLRLQQVPQAMRAEIEQVAARRQRRLSHGPGRLGEEDLLAIPGPQQARQAVQAGSEIVAVAGGRLPDVDGHPHPQRTEIAPIFLSQRRLRGDGGRDRRRHGWERGLDRIADRLEEDAVLGRDRVVEQGEVALDRRPHRRGIALPALGAALDVGEEEGNCPARELGHSSAPATKRRPERTDRVHIRARLVRFRLARAPRRERRHDEKHSTLRIVGNAERVTGAAIGHQIRHNARCSVPRNDVALTREGFPRWTTSHSTDLTRLFSASRSRRDGGAGRARHAPRWHAAGPERAMLPPNPAKGAAARTKVTSQTGAREAGTDR